MLPIVISGVILIGAGLSLIVYRSADREVNQGRKRSIANFPAFRVISHVVRGVAVAFAVIALLWPSVPVALFIFEPVAMGAYIGCFVATAGLVVSAWAIRTLGAEYSPCYDARQPNVEVKEGPYRAVRHPIYLGNVLALIGLFIIGPSAWTAAAITVAIVFYMRAASTEVTELQQMHIGRMCEHESTAEGNRHKVDR